MSVVAAELSPAAVRVMRWRVGAIELDEQLGRLSIDGIPVALDRSGFDLLRCLMRNAGQVIGKEELLRVGWPGRVVSENSLAKAIGRLRQTLRDPDGELLRVVHGYGYKLAGSVSSSPVTADVAPKPERPAETAEDRVDTTIARLSLYRSRTIAGIALGLALMLFAVTRVDLSAGAPPTRLAVPARAAPTPPPSIPVLAADRRGTDSAEAYEQWLLARSIFQDDETAGRRSLAAYERAVALDPAFAAAWIGIASVVGHSGFYADDAKQALAGKQRALDALNHAIAIDPGNALAFLMRGDYRYAHWWDWPGAEQDLERAVLLAPEETESYLIRMSRVRAAFGNLQEALALNRRALELNPESGARTVMGYHLTALGEFAQARELLEAAVRKYPIDEHAHYYLGLGELLQARPGAALLHFENSAHYLRLTGLAIAYHSLGDRSASERNLQLLKTRYGHLTPYQAASVHAWRGEVDFAFQELERALELRDASVMYFKFDPLLHSLRATPRFRSLLRRVNLPE